MSGKIHPQKRRRRGSSATLAVTAAVLAVCQSHRADATTSIFTGAGDGTNWSNAGNWTTGGVAGVAPSNTAPGNDINFDPSASLQVKLDTSRIANSLNFSSGAAALDTSGSTNVLTVTTGNINVGSGFSATINSVLSSSNVVTVTGGGALNLNNSGNSFSSGLTVYGNDSNDPGVVVNDLGALGGGPIILTRSGTIEANLSSAETLTQPIYIGGNGSFDGGLETENKQLTISGPISGANLNVLYLYGAPGTALQLTGNTANTFPGHTVIDTTASGAALTVVLAKSAGVTALPGSSATIDNVILDLGANNQISSQEELTLGSAIFNLSGFSTSVGSISDFPDSVILLGSGNLTVGANGISTAIGGNINGTGGSFTKVGGAILELSGTNAFTGPLNISGGILQAGSVSALGKASLVTVGPGASLDLNGQAIGALPLALNGVGANSVGAVTNTPLTAASYAGTVNLASNTTFGGAGNITLNANVSGSGGLTQNGTNTLNLSGGANFSGGLTITSGTVVIGAAGTYSGGINLSGGTLSISADTGLGATSNSIAFSNGGTLSALGSFSTSRSFASTGGGFSLVAGATVTQSGTLSGSGTFTETGGGIWRLTSANPFAGSLVIAGGTLSLAGTSGAMGSIASIDLQTTGTLELNSTTALGGNQSSQNRINDAAPITLDGGTLSVLGANGIATTETLGELIPNFGASTISLTDGTGTGSAVTVTFASLAASNPGSTISVMASDLGNTEQVFVASGVANGTVFNGGVTVNGTDFAKYSTTQGVIPFAASDYTVNVFTSGTNVKLDPAVTSPPVPGSVGTVSIKTLNIAADVAAVAVNQSAGTTLTLTNGGLLTSGTHPVTITGGTLNSSSGELDISVGSGGLTISSALAGSFVLTKRGIGTLALTGNAASTYTGFTLVSGEMDLNKSGGAIAIPGNLIIDGGTLKSLASGQIASTATVTLNYGTWNLNGQTENISQLNNSTGTMLFNGGKLNVSNGVLLAGGTTTVASTLNSASVLTVSGGDNQVHAGGLVSTEALAFLGSSPSVQLFSDAASPGELSLPAGANMSFSGTGTASISSTGAAAIPGIVNLQNSSNHTITVSPGCTMIISGEVTNGGFTAQGGGTLVLTGTNTFTGAITVENGTTVDEVGPANGPIGLGNPHAVVFAGGILSLSSDLQKANFSITPDVVTSATIDLSTVTPGLSAGVFSLTNLNVNSSAGLTVAGQGTLSSGIILMYNAADSGPVFIHNSAAMTAGIDGFGGITESGEPAGTNIDIIKDQAGTLTMEGSGNNFYGSLTVTNGSVKLDQTSGVAVPNNLQISGGSLVQFEQSNQILPTSNVTINAATGASLLDLNGCTNTLGSLYFIAGGTMNTGAGMATLGGGVNFSGAIGTALINGNLNLGTTSPTFNISRGSSAADLQVNAIISGSVGINKTGTGILYLSATNTFTGPITISAGTLKADFDANLGNSANTVNLSGGTLSMANVSSGTLGRLLWNGGTLSILSLSSSYTAGLNIPNHAIVTLNSNLSNAISISPGGVLNLNPNSASGILVRGLSTISLTTGSSPFAQVNVLAATSESTRQLLITTSLNIAGTINAWQGKVDLANNDMDVLGGSLVNITNQIKEGYAGGRWNGAGGIISSSAAADTTHLTTLGVIQNNQSGSAIFTASKPFDTTMPGVSDILVKSTYYGDTNLDGKLDGSDYSRIDAAYLADKSNPSAATGWFNGDFNYDGVVNGSDYTLIDNAFNTQGALIASSIADPSAITSDQIAGVSAVPEPTAGIVLCIGATALLRRRQSRMFHNVPKCSTF